MSRNAEKNLDQRFDRQTWNVLAIHPGTFWFGDVFTGHRQLSWFCGELPVDRSSYVAD